MIEGLGEDGGPAAAASPGALVVHRPGAPPRIGGLKVEWREYDWQGQLYRVWPEPPDWADPPSPESVASPMAEDSGESGSARPNPAFGLWAVVDDLNRLFQGLSQEEFERDEERMPYFAVIWPSAEAAAGRLLSGPPLAGREVLDLGCGLGLVGLAALVRGARVTFLDWEPRALEIVAASLAINRVAAERCALVAADWRRPPRGLGPFDLIVGADVMYEKRSPAPVAAFLARHLKPGAEAWIVDPDRPYAPELVVRARDRGLLHSGRQELAPGINLFTFRRPRWQRKYYVQDRGSGRRVPLGGADDS